MIITADMLLWAIGRNYPVQLELAGDGASEVDSVLLVMPDGSVGDGLVCSDDAGIPKTRAFSGTSDAGSLLIACPGSKLPSGLSPNHPVVRPMHDANVHPNSSVAEGAWLLGLAFREIAELSRWEAKLASLVASQAGPQQLMHEGERFIDRPMSLFDTSLKVLAWTASYLRWAERASEVEDVGAFGMPELFKVNDEGDYVVVPSEAARLVDDPDYHAASYIEELFYYPLSEDRKLCIGVNHYRDGEYVARLIVRLLDDETRFPAGLERLIMVFADHLFASFEQIAIVEHRPDDLMHMVCESLISGSSAARSLCSEALASWGWKEDDPLLLLKLDFFEGTVWDVTSPYLCRVLERRWPESCAVPMDDSVVWILNSRGHDPARHLMDEDAMRTTLVRLFQDYACRAGIGDVFVGLEKLGMMRRQAEVAIEMGMRIDPHLTHHSFSDYRLAYMLQSMCGDLESELVCHPGVSWLVEEDRRCGTDYSRTLAVYLKNHLNTTRASEELHMHRTTLARRLHRIEETTGIDLDDPDEVLLVALSLRICGLIP